MWRKLTLRSRIYMMLFTLVLITVVGGSVMVWYTFQMDFLLNRIINKYVAGFQAAEALETALVNQKGFVSYYFLDGDPDWLRQLGEYRQIFRQRLAGARQLAETKRERKAIELIEGEYDQYIRSKDRVIALYQAGEDKRGSRLHPEVRTYFFKILELCNKYKKLHSDKMKRAKDDSHHRAERLRIIAGCAIFLVLGLGVLLVSVLVRQILGPVRRMALETNPENDAKESMNEVKALSRRVQGLIEDVDQTHSELERSRETLLQSEKMAMVGKLAAGTAHSIRNPLTSLKMRLFSLSRTLDLSEVQKDDFEVISQEIQHIDTIVENFLEFARPPKLKMQRVSPSEIVDLALRLVHHRLQANGVEVRLRRVEALPETAVDPEQLKEVLVNLLTNACEAMDGGGMVVLQEEESFAEPLGRVSVIRLTDTGSGIPQSLQEKVFQPFFTTKEEGTGLGLSIATRIVEEHGGWLDFRSVEGQGTTFVLTLPIKES